MTDIRVMHLISEMDTGGAESVVVELARRGRDVGWLSAVASNGGCRVDDLTQAGVPHFLVASARRTVRGFIAARATTARVFRDFQPDIVIAHNVSATVVARLARPQAPLLTVFHGVTDAEYAITARLLEWTSDRVVVVSNTIGQRLINRGLRRVPVSTIPNAVAVLQPMSQSEARADLGLPDDVPVALCLARMERQKRHDLLLDAWSLLSDEEVLLLAGDGSQRQRLERQAKSLGDRVRFLGNRTDVSTLLSATDVTVLISDWEGLPMAILESLAAGRPVVATVVGGVREILGQGGGRLVAPGSVEGIAAALTEMLYDEAARRQAACMGLANVRENHDVDQMMRRYGDVVGEMVAEAS
jgi:glycosyltransferase involved in cell wall biosynthesis